MTSDSVFEREDFNDILEHWQNQKPGRWHFEGESGVRHLEQLVSDLGYDQGIEEFLADNSGAMQAIVEWITEWADRGTEWKENLAKACNYEGIDDDEEDEYDYEEGVEELLIFARTLNPNPEQKRIIDQIQAELDANDAENEWNKHNWEHQAIAQLKEIIKQRQEEIDAPETSL